MSSTAAAATTSCSILPPAAYRDEDRVILAGKLAPSDPGYYAPTKTTKTPTTRSEAAASPGDDEEEKEPVLRQAIGSPEKLLDPPIPVRDPYGWMRSDDRSDAAVLEHLTAENAYTHAVTSHLAGLRQHLYDEMLAGIQETDYTVPTPKTYPDGTRYLYYTRTYAGKAYPSYCRAPYVENWHSLSQLWDGSSADILPNEVAYLDVNDLIGEQTYCAVGSVRINPHDPHLLAYTVDFSGNEVTQLYVKDLRTNEIVDHDPQLDMYGAIQWGGHDDDAGEEKETHTIYYVTLDETKRPYQLYRRTIRPQQPTHEENNNNNNAAVSSNPDELLFQEDDELFWLHISKSFDGTYLFLSSGSKETSEVQYINLVEKEDGKSSSNNKLQCIAKRRSKVLYRVSHHKKYWYIRTNIDGTPNLRLMISPAVADSEQLWKNLVVRNEDADENENNAVSLFDGGYDRSIDGITHFTNNSVVTGREHGLPQVWFLSYNHKEEVDVKSSSSEPVVDKFFRLDFDEDAYDVGLGTNYDDSADAVVIAYDSLITPLSYLSIPLHDPVNLDARSVLKTKVVPGYNKNDYGCERTTVLSRDGKTNIPVSIVYRKDVLETARQEGNTVPTHLYGYGSYSACMEASFRTTRRTLLDRGMIYVIAHIRGGGEMGRQWYEEPNGAKYLCKKNTFNDFVDIARWLTTPLSSSSVDSCAGITTSKQLSCEGRSAGGLLIGASINQQPDLFKAALLGVPFVDVVPTMIDATVPLTVVEWEEWGNPNEEKYHQYMMEYSPINNCQPNGKYPSCLLTGGLHDPRVQYWEPTKFAAEIRHQSSAESGPCCVKIDMDAGHFSASDRYKYLRELSFDYAFLLDQLGLVE